MYIMNLNAQSVALKSCMGSGGNAFITKPFSKNNIIKTFSEYITEEETEYVRRFTLKNNINTVKT